MLLRVPLLSVLLAIVTGLFFANQQYWSGAFTGALFLLLGLSRPWLAFFSFFLGLSLFNLHSAKHYNLLHGQSTIAQFAHSGMEVTCQKALVLGVKQSTKGVIAEIRAPHVRIPHSTQTLPRNSRYTLFSPSPLSEGQHIQFQGRLSATQTSMNFGALDWSSYNTKKGLTGAIAAESVHVLNSTHWRYHYARLRDQLQEGLLRRLLYKVPTDSDATWVIPALVMGIDPQGDELHSFRDAGAMHLFVVSGLHVGLVITIVWGLLYFTPLSSLEILGTSLIIAWLYVLLTGAEPPALRSALIITIYSLGIIWRQRASVWNSLTASLILILLLDQYALRSIGVLLSFGVVGTLILLVQFTVTRASRWAAPDPFLPRLLWSEPQALKLSLARWSIGVVVVAIVSWLTSSVITAIYFGRVYLFGIIASLLLFPAAFCMMGLSALSLVTSFISPPLSASLNQYNAAIAEQSVALAQRIERHPASVWKVHSYGYSDQLTVFNLPKGGAALYLDLDGGILIDCGREWTARSIIAPALERSGKPVRTIYLSHNDIAHEGGASEFPATTTVNSYELPSQSHQHGSVRIETLQITSTITTRADDNLALFRIITPTGTIGYLSDAGVQTLAFLRQNKLSFPCDLLILGEHTQEPVPPSDFAAYTGAHTVILNRTYYHRTKQESKTPFLIDQRYHGAVQIPLNKSITPSALRACSPLNLELFKKK